MIKANNPTLKSWIAVKQDSDFPIQNLPFGIFQAKDKLPCIGVAIGEQVLDLNFLAQHHYFDALNISDLSVFQNQYLNDFMALGKEMARTVRNRISELLQDDNAELRDNAAHRKEAFYSIDDVAMLLPVKVGDYTDFYSSEYHATNVGIMFRDPANALMPNWKHIPVGYHGRASSIIVSGESIHRPKGQLLPKGAEQPIFGPCRLLDFELEMAFVTCKENKLGDSVTTDEADDYIFGFVLFNDWSARDIQKWEYVPLGPFLGKNFASSVSPWIVTMDALAPFRVPCPEQNPKVMPYLESEGDRNFDINLQVAIQAAGSEEQVVSNSNYKYMYWNVNQQLAHHTVNGCNIKVGDLYGSGTISGPTPDSYGSMLEISWQGTKSITMPDGTARKFIQDNDTVIMRGYAEKDGVRVGFGAVSTKILPAK